MCGIVFTRPLLTLFFPLKKCPPFRLQETVLLGFDSCLVFLQFPLSPWLSSRLWGSGGWAMVFSYTPHPSPLSSEATARPRQHPRSHQSSLLPSWVTEYRGKADLYHTWRMKSLQAPGEKLGLCWSLDAQGERWDLSKTLGPPTFHLNQPPSFPWTWEIITCQCQANISSLKGNFRGVLTGASGGHVWLLLQIWYPSDLAGILAQWRRQFWPEYLSRAPPKRQWMKAHFLCLSMR